MFLGSDWYRDLLFQPCSDAVGFSLSSFFPHFVFSVPTTISFLPLFLLSPCHTIFCLTCCLSAGMLSAGSLSQSFAVVFICINRKTLHFLFCAIYLPLSLPIPGYSALCRIVALLLSTCPVIEALSMSVHLCWAFTYASLLLMTNPAIFVSLLFLCFIISFSVSLCPSSSPR